MDFSTDLDAFIQAHGFALVADSAKGQRTVATRRFRRGDTLFSIRPLFGFPIRTGEDDEESTEAAVSASSRCANCFDALPAKRPQCSQCHAVQYCSMVCLKEHWTARHHIECQRVPARAVDAESAKVKPVFRPYLRMLVGVGKVIGFVGECRAKKLPVWLRVQAAAWDRLVAHQEQHPAHILRQYSEIARVAEKGAEIGSLPFSGVDALCRFGCNNFVAYDQRVRASGHLCSPVTSLLLNHSCYPNAAFVYTKAGEQQVVALSDISEGQEIALAYVDGLKPRSERKKILGDVYFFDCECRRCLDTSTDPVAHIDRLFDRDVARVHVPGNLPTDFSTAALPEPWVVSIVSSLTALTLKQITALDFAQNCLSAVQNLPPHDFSFVAYRHWLECQDECLDSAAASMPWDWAYVSALYILAYYACVYPPFHPLVGLQCLECAKLAWNSLQSGPQTWGDST
ncbi:hypothetical protein EC988_005284, partial [Linderina pennispora]